MQQMQSSHQNCKNRKTKTNSGEKMTLITGFPMSSFSRLNVVVVVVVVAGGGGAKVKLCYKLLHWCLLRGW